MQAADRHTTRARRTRPPQRPGVVIEMNSLARTRREVEDQPMRCVSSGYLAGGCSCGETIPAAVVNSVWSRELGRWPRSGGRFFEVSWQDEVWLAFGLANGEIRGVYCPAHRAEREARSIGHARPRDDMRLERSA